MRRGDFQLLLAQGVAKRKGGRPRNKNRNRKRVRNNFSYFSGTFTVDKYNSITGYRFIISRNSSKT